MLKKVFNWSESHLSEVTSYKIHNFFLVLKLFFVISLKNLLPNEYEAIDIFSKGCPGRINYHTLAIITCCLYIFYPIFEDNYFVFKEFFSENYVPMFVQYSRAGYGGALMVLNFKAHLKMNMCHK